MIVFIEIATDLAVVADDDLIDEGETITITSPPSHGSFANTLPATFTSATGGSSTSFILTFTSDTDYIGTDSFEYTLTTASGDRDSAAVSLTITNDPANPDLNPDGNALTSQ